MTLLTFPVVDSAHRASGDWPLTDTQVSDWNEMFPRLDGPAECAKARAWILANQTRRKTPKGMPRFLVNWLLRAERARTMNIGRTLDALQTRVRWQDTCQHEPTCGSAAIHETAAYLDAERVKRAQR